MYYILKSKFYIKNSTIMILKDLIKSYNLYVRLIPILLIYIAYVFFFKNIFTFLPKNIAAIVMFTNIVYILINLWYYFINIYKFSSYTSSVQRFWKRTFSLFWVIEGFLFLIFLYLWLISPQETSVFLDPYNQNNFYFSIKKEFFNYLVPLISLILSWYLLLFFKKKSNISYLLLIILLLTSYLFTVEFLKFIQVLNFLSGSKTVYLGGSTANGSITELLPLYVDSYIELSDRLPNLKCNTVPSDIYVSSTNLKSVLVKRTETFYLNIVIFLKFWHLVLITLLALLTIQKSLLDMTLSMDLVSSNMQNYIYVLFFFFLNFLFLFKKYVYIYFKYVYFWFFENYSLVNHTLVTIQEIVMLLL